MRRAYLLLLLLATTLARADALTLCVDANDWAPYTYAHRDGTLQVLVKMAAIQLGDTVSFVALPWLRCQKSVENGDLQGMVATSDTCYALNTFALPHANGAVDTGRALGSGAIVLLRRVGSHAQWDGQRLRGQRGAVLYVFGYSDVGRHLEAIGVDSNNAASSNEQNARKVLAGRADVMAIYLGDVNALLARPEFAGRLEVMQPALGDSQYYLAINQSYYAAHRANIEQLWNQIGLVRNSANYRQAIGNMR